VNHFGSKYTAPLTRTQMRDCNDHMYSGSVLLWAPESNPVRVTWVRTRKGVQEGRSIGTGEWTPIVPGSTVECF
jgi:hypothetical protein